MTQGFLFMLGALLALGSIGVTAISVLLTIRFIIDKRRKRDSINRSPK